MSPITSPMRFAALPSSVMVLTVRLDSATARAATSVDRVACKAISPIEAASSSIELATVVTLMAAVPQLFSAPHARGVRLRLHRRKALALDHIVAEHNHRARHGADLVMRACGRNSG